MELTGLLHGAPLLRHVDFPVTEVLGPAATEAEIQRLIDRHKMIFIKPVFKGGVGQKGKAGLIGRASDLRTALAEKERLFFAEHRHGNATAKANGVTFEAGIPAEHEVYFSISDFTLFRAPTMTLTHMGGVDIEELDKQHLAKVPFDALTGLKAFVVANAVSDIGGPKEIVSPLVQHLPKLWELFHHYGMTTLELNPIRMSQTRDGRLTPVACDFKGGFDRDDPRWQRLDLPDDLFTADTSSFELEVNQLRTHQGQSDVFMINPKGTILAPTFGGGANSLVTEVLGEAAIISSDFGGNPPYEKMKAVAAICFKHWLAQTNVLFIIGGKSNKYRHL
jgi:succinyl-CoA synthetase beta subunit